MSIANSTNNFQEKRKNVWWLSITSFFTDISSEMIFPILPIFLKNVLGTSFIFIGLIEGVAEGLSSLLKYFSGYLSDYFNQHKKPTIIGYGLSALAKLFFALAGSAFVVFIFRSLDRIGKGIRTAPRDSLIAESVPVQERGRYFGLHRTADTLGAILGTLIATGLLFFLKEQINIVIRIVLLFSFIPAILGLVFLFKVKEGGQVSVKKEKRLPFDLSYFSKDYKYFLLMAVFFGLANYSYAFYILKADDVGVFLFLIPIIYLVYNIFYAVSSYPAGWLSDKIGRKIPLISAFFLFALVNLGFAFKTTGTTIWFLFSLYGLFIGITDSILRALVADLSLAEKRGEAFGFYYMVVGLSTLVGNFIGGLVWQNYGAAAPFVLSAFWILGAAFLLFFIKIFQQTDNTVVHQFRAYRS